MSTCLSLIPIISYSLTHWMIAIATSLGNGYYWFLLYYSYPAMANICGQNRDPNHSVKLITYQTQFTKKRVKFNNYYRWKRKEVHDILVECAKLSLDLNEGFREDADEPLLPTSVPKHAHLTHLTKYDQNIMSPKQFTSGFCRYSPLRLIGHPA